MTDARHRRDDEAGLGPDALDVRSVLVLRPGGVAEVVRAIPALRHLRETYEHAVVTVAATAPARELLDACPYVDRVLDIGAASEALLEHFDVAVSFARPGADVPLEVEDVDASFRASWREAGTPERRAIHPAWPDRLDDATRMLRLAWLLGGSLKADASLGLWPRLADRNGAASLVAGMTRPIALVHPGAGQADRRWQPAGWAAIVDLLDGIGIDAVLVGSVRDQRAADAVLGRTRTAPLVVVGRTSIGELCGLLERAVLFVGGDSAPAALAGALGVRSVVVGPASAFEHVPRPGIVDLVDAGPCTRCGEHACHHPAPAARDVPLERVLGRVELAATTALERWHRSRIA
jgi:ADP-heptose:LPS heptosyltransferase